MCAGEIRYFRDVHAFETGEESKGVIILLSAWLSLKRRSLEMAIHTEFRSYRLRAVSKPPCHCFPSSFPFIAYSSQMDSNRLLSQKTLESFTSCPICLCPLNTATLA